jgi:hypothetical protein
MKKFIVFLIFVFVALGYSQEKDFGKTKLINAPGLIKEQTPFYTHLISTDRFISRFDSSKMKYKFEKKGSYKYVDFEVKNDANKTMEIEFLEDGIKETVIVDTGSAIVDSVIYKIDANVLWSLANGQIVYYDKKDGRRLYLTPTITATAEVDTGTYNVLLDVYKSGNKLIVRFDGSKGYPVVVDPTITISEVLMTNFGSLRNTRSSYDSARGARYATQNLTASGMGIGIYRSAGDTVVQRSYVTIIPPNIIQDTMQTDSIFYDIYVYAETNKWGFRWYSADFDTFGLEDFRAFPGFQGGATPYTAVALTDSLHDGIVTVGAYNSMKFTSAGIDTFWAHIQDSLQMIAIASRDYDGDEPSGTADEVYARDTTGSQRPRIRIFYTVILPPIDSVRGTAYSNDSIQVSVYPDTTGTVRTVAKIVNFGRYIDSVKQTRADSVAFYSITNVPIDTSAWTPDDSIVISARRHSSVDSDLKSPMVFDTVYTLADVPSFYEIVRITGDSFAIAFNDNNPGRTEYAIYNNTQSRWVNANGDTTPTETWTTRATLVDTFWINKNGLTEMSIKIKARNGDNIETAFSGDFLLQTSFFSISVTWGNDSTVTVTLVDSANGTSKRWVDTQLPTADSLVTDTTLKNGISQDFTITGLDANKLYQFIGGRKDSVSLKSFTPYSDSIYTDLPPLIAPTITFQSDTTFKALFDTTGVFANIGAYFAIGDSDLIDRGSTRVYYGSNWDSMTAYPLFFTQKALIDSTFKIIVKHTADDTIRVFLRGSSGIPTNRVQ